MIRIGGYWYSNFTELKEFEAINKLGEVRASMLEKEFRRRYNGENYIDNEMQVLFDNKIYRIKEYEEEFEGILSFIALEDMGMLEEIIYNFPPEEDDELDKYLLTGRPSYIIKELLKIKDMQAKINVVDVGGAREIVEVVYNKKNLFELIEEIRNRFGTIIDINVEIDKGPLRYEDMDIQVNITIGGLKEVSNYLAKGQTNITEGMNAKKIQGRFDTYDYYSAIIPTGKNGLTVKEVNDGSSIIYGEKLGSRHKYKFFTDERYEDPEQLYNDALLMLRNDNKPSKVYEVDYVKVEDILEKNKIILYKKALLWEPNEVHYIFEIVRDFVNPYSSIVRFGNNKKTLQDRLFIEREEEKEYVERTRRRDEHKISLDNYNQDVIIADNTRRIDELFEGGGGGSGGDGGGGTGPNSDIKGKTIEIMDYETYSGMQLKDGGFGVNAAGITMTAFGPVVINSFAEEGVRMNKATFGLQGGQAETSISDEGINTNRLNVDGILSVSPFEDRMTEGGYIYADTYDLDMNETRAAMYPGVGFLSAFMQNDDKFAMTFHAVEPSVVGRGFGSAVFVGLREKEGEHNAIKGNRKLGEYYTGLVIYMGRDDKGNEIPSELFLYDRGIVKEIQFK